MKRVYFSPSNQEHNVGVGTYGTEERRMHELATLCILKMRRFGDAFTTRKSLPEWDMTAVCSDSNRWKSDIHVCLHSNAGSPASDGTIGFYGSDAGRRLTQLIYKYVAALSPGSDYGIKEWGALFEIRHTVAPCAYLEVIFHTNRIEAADLIARRDKYAEAIVHGICDYFHVAYTLERPLDRTHIRQLIDKAPSIDLAWLLQTTRRELAERDNV